MVAFILWQVCLHILLQPPLQHNTVRPRQRTHRLKANKIRLFDTMIRVMHHLLQQCFVGWFIITRAIAKAGLPWGV